MTTRNPLVVVRDLCFAYAHADVLHDVSMHVFPGEVVAVAGPNGSGKSTLVELIAGVLRPRGGTVRRRGDLALVLQRPDAPSALPLTVSDVVAMGTWRAGRRLSRASATASVAVALERVGMTAHATRPLAALSGGQRQRAFLAQGIVGRSDLLLLDEPATGLDRESAQRIREVLAQEAGRGAGVICVTHHESDLRGADRVLRLDRGVVVESEHPLDGGDPAVRPGLRRG